VTVTRERFEQGMSYADYRSQMTRNGERFDETERTVELSAQDVAYFSALPSPLHVVVLAEDWCGDVIANLPVLGRLAAESGKLNLRIFLRDQNLDIMEQYLKDGQFRSIPVFIFFDQNFRELGHWIERPAAMTTRVQEVRVKHFASDPELAGISPTTSPSELPEGPRLRLSQTLTTFRTENRNFSDSEVIREIRALISGAAPVRSAQDVAIPLATTGKPTWQQASRPPAEEPIKVSITYCAECGYEPQTLALTSALMMEFRADLASIELIPWHDGMFDVVVDGELVHSMMRDGGFPDSGTIFNAVRNRLGALQPS
jgi:selT/selW/selH-like putative selenoprotein